MRTHHHPALRQSWLAEAFCALLLAGCGGPEPTEHVVLRPDSSLVSEVRLTTLEPDEPGRVVFDVAPEASWRDLLRVDPCGPFHPGMSFAEAEARFGPPDERGGGHMGAWVDYVRDGFRYRIGSYIFATGGIPLLLPDEEASYQEWVLEAHPVANRVSDVFVPEVAVFIDGNRDHAAILGPDHPAVLVMLAGLRVRYLFPTKWAGCGAPNEGT